VNTVSNKVVKNPLAYLSVQKMIRGERPFCVKTKMPISNQYSL